MKIFISADLEGVNGVVAPEDVEEAGSGYQQARVFMTEEVNAVVEGAFAGGAAEILVCDSHNVSQNIRMDLLDSRVRLMRGVSRRNSMVHGLDETFDGLILLGYHAKFGTQKAVLDHTYDPITIADLSVNGHSVGEMGFNALYAASKGVPLIMVTGDQALAAETKAFCPEAETAVVKYAQGRYCAECLPRAESQKLLRDTAEKAVRTAREKKPFPVKAGEKLEMTVTFRQTCMADGAEKLPGVRRTGAMSVAVEAENMEELMGLRQIEIAAGGDCSNPMF